MHDEVVKAALDRLVPPAQEDAGGWELVERRAGRLRRRRHRTMAGLAAGVSVAVFGTLAAAGQIGFVSHSRAPHLVVRGTLYTADGRRAGSLDLELERAVVAFGRQVRLMKWRHPDGMFSARWFVDLGKTGERPERAAIVVRHRYAHAGSTIVVLCDPCRGRASGRLQLSPAQASALVNDEGRAVVTVDGGNQLSAAAALDRSSLRRGLLCLHPGAACTRIYTGRT